MITLHLLQHLEDNGFGNINQTLLWEKLPLNTNGIAIFSRGGETFRSGRAVQQFDLYSRGSSDIQGAQDLEKIWIFFTETKHCDLPKVTSGSCLSDKQYQNCVIEAQSALENLGLDRGDRVLFRWSYQINYNKGETNE